MIDGVLYGVGADGVYRDWETTSRHYAPGVVRAPQRNHPGIGILQNSVRVRVLDVVAIPSPVVRAD